MEAQEGFKSSEHGPILILKIEEQRERFVSPLKESRMKSLHREGHDLKVLLQHKRSSHKTYQLTNIRNEALC